MKTLFCLSLLLFLLAPPPCLASPDISSPLADDFLEDIFTDLGDLVADDPSETIGSLPETDAVAFTDAGFTQASLNFSPGQTIFFRVQSQIQAPQIAEVRILANDHSFLAGYPLSRQGGFYLSQFPAPAAPGQYYFDARLKNASGDFNSQQNFTVTTGSSQPSPSSQPSLAPLPGDLATPSFEVSPSASLSFFQSVTLFLRKLFLALLGQSSFAI